VSYRTIEPVSVEIRTSLFCTAAFAAGKRILEARDRAAKNLKTEEKCTTRDQKMITQPRKVFEITHIILESCVDMQP
jgi:hypothetical protein